MEEVCELSVDFKHDEKKMKSRKFWISIIKNSLAKLKNPETNGVFELSYAEQAAVVVGLRYIRGLMFNGEDPGELLELLNIKKKGIKSSLGCRPAVKEKDKVFLCTVHSITGNGEGIRDIHVFKTADDAYSFEYKTKQSHPTWWCEIKKVDVENYFDERKCVYEKRNSCGN